MQKKAEGNIKVFCRFRPFNAKQLEANATKIHRIQNKKQLVIKDVRAQEASFMFDYVFDVDSTQQEVYEKLGMPILNNVIDGFNGTIMAYGQTSSGKTHTMQGYDVSEKQNRGIMPRMIENIFNQIQKSPENLEFKLKISIFQLYMEKIRDLLDVSKNDCKIRENKAGCFVQNITEVYVSEKTQLNKIINYGQKNRITAATNMNEHSSRSHLIFLLTVNQFNSLQNSSKTSKLFLIDLAGSQKISKTGAEGKVLEEAKKINLSLTNLGKVIKALSQKGQKSHVPYRDSKLTRILKDSLGGNSKTSLIVTCSPHEMHIHQTISTLRFGENAQKVKNKPKINRQLTVQELQKIIEKIQADISEKDLKIKILEDYIKIDLKAELPKNKTLQPTQIQPNPTEKQQQEQVMPRNEQVKDNENELQLKKINEQVQQRIKSLQMEFQSSQMRLKAQMDKYYHLKKQYNLLHDNLTSIVKQNMSLQQQLQDKKKKSIFDDKSLNDNSYLIRMILGEICDSIGKDNQEKLIKSLHNCYWYKKIVGQQVSCLDYWLKEKQEISMKFQKNLMESELTQQILRKKQESRVSKDNQKIIELESKLDLVFEQYNNMISVQTSWKAECQLYERKLKHKDEQIKKLQERIADFEGQLEDTFKFEGYNSDDVSIRSNRIVKPIKGGAKFK